MPFVFLEFKLEKDKCGSYIFNLKCCKTEETTYLEERKQQRNYSRRFSMLRCLAKGNNIGPCQQTRKVQCMYLALIHLKIISINVQQWSQNLKQSMNDGFRS